jgi:hypothetical protein
MLSTLEQLEKIRDMAINKMNEIIGRERKPAVETVITETEVATEAVASSEFEPEAQEAVAASEEAGTPPEPKATKPRPVGRRGRNGEVNKSGLIREYFAKCPQARNQEVIEYVKEKHKIELQPSLVSTVKLSMNIPKSKRGRVKGKVAARAVAKAKRNRRKDGLTAVACVTKVVAKSKGGLRIDDVVSGVKKLYDYSGKQGEQGLKNVIYQALYALSLKKERRGWEGSAPVILHDDERHTWKLNPKAKRKIA